LTRTGSRCCISGEQLFAKGGARHLRETQFLDRLTRRGDQIFLSAADESRVEGVFGEGQIDDRFCDLDDGAPLPAIKAAASPGAGSIASVSVGRTSSVARPVIVRPAKSRAASMSMISAAECLADEFMPRIALTSRYGAGVLVSRISMPSRKIRRYWLRHPQLSLRGYM